MTWGWNIPNHFGITGWGRWDWSVYVLLAGFVGCVILLGFFLIGWGGRTKLSFSENKGFEMILMVTRRYTAWCCFFAKPYPPFFPLGSVGRGFSAMRIGFFFSFMVVCRKYSLLIYCVNWTGGAGGGLSQFHSCSPYIR